MSTSTRSPRWIPALALAALAVLLAASSATAQQAAPAPAPAGGEKAVTASAAPAAAPAATGGAKGSAFGSEKKMSLLSWFIIGGWCMWPLLGCSIAAVFLVIRNFMILNSTKLLREDLVPQLSDNVIKLDIKAVRSLCQGSPTLMTRILDAGMDRVETAGLDIPSIEKAMEEASTEEVASYMLPINAINIIAVVAPMLGLLGTVSGMIKAFFNISLGGMGKPEMLANNIGEALITTEAGLIIAVPAMAFYFYFKNDFVKTVALTGKLIGRLIDRLRVEATNQAAAAAGQAGT